MIPLISYLSKCIIDDWEVVDQWKTGCKFEKLGKEFWVGVRFEADDSPSLTVPAKFFSQQLR